MENKYYLPKIEEFHIGFEYEVRQQEMQYGECVYGNEWETIECEGNMFLQYIDISSGNIRVKYLDRSDIESFGFKFDATRSKVDGNFVGSYENEKYYLDYSPYSYSGEFNSSVHLRVMKIKDIPITSYQSNYQFIYDGIIKNKSELKKLLIQLEIINE